MRTWVIGDQWGGPEPPGWPVLLATGPRTGRPLWAVQAGCGGLLTVSLLGTVWRWLSAAVALVLTAIVVRSSCYLCNAASYPAQYCRRLKPMVLRPRISTRYGNAQAASGLACGCMAGPSGDSALWCGPLGRRGSLTGH